MLEKQDLGHGSAKHGSISEQELFKRFLWAVPVQ